MRLPVPLRRLQAGSGERADGELRRVLASRGDAILRRPRMQLVRRSLPPRDQGVEQGNRHLQVSDYISAGSAYIPRGSACIPGKSAYIPGFYTYIPES